MNTKKGKRVGVWFYLWVILLLLSTFIPLLAFGQTVTSVTPNHIRLEGGGRDVAVTIKGIGLDKVTSVQVVMNNQPVKEILAVLKAPVKAPVGPPPGRQVTLKASPRAMIGANYQLRVMIGTVPINLPIQIVRVEVVKADAAATTPAETQAMTSGKMMNKKPLPLPPAQVDRHEKLVNTEKLQPIGFKPFTYQDFKDPKTGQPIGPDTVVTLKNGKQIKGKDFLDKINELEQQFNGFGHTFRKPRAPNFGAKWTDGKGASHFSHDLTKVPSAYRNRVESVPDPVPLQASVINTDLMQKQKERDNKAKAEAQVKFQQQPLKVKPYDKSSFIKKTATSSQASPTRIRTAAVTTQSLQEIISKIPTTTFQPFNFVQEWGDRDWFAVKVNAGYTLTANQNKMRIEAGGSAAGIVFNSDESNIVSVTGSAEAPTQANQAWNASLVVTVGGDAFFNYSPSPQTGSLLIGDDKSIDVDQSVSFHWVIVVIPVELRLGFRGSAGVVYGFELAPLKAKALFVPYVDTRAYAEVSLELEVVRGGMGGELTFLKASLPIGATVGVETEPSPYLFAEYYVQNTITALSGRIYAFAEVDVWLWSDYWSWDIFKWTGFTYDDYLINDRTKPIPILTTGGGIVTSPPSTQSPKLLYVEKPKTGGVDDGDGTVTSSPYGINCLPHVSKCQGSYKVSEKVTLTATPDSASTFKGWGGTCSGIGPCTVTMNADTTVTALFTRNTDYDVTIYQDINYTGRKLKPKTYTITLGQCQVLDPDLTKSGWNDMISSVKVGSKVGVAFFEHINYGGGRVDTVEDVPRLSARWSGWNDKVSSLIVFLKEGGPSGVHLKGKHRIFLPVGKNCDNVAYWSLKDFGESYNDDATNLYVWPNLRVRLYQDTGHKGKGQQTFTGPGQFDITDKNLKGKVSSVLIEGTEGIPKR